jgi:transposase
VVVSHAPTVCAHCQQALTGVTGAVVERRQVHDLPPLRLEVTEHRAVAVRCSACQAVTRGAFPPTVSAAAQYGPRLRALAVYLHHYQLVPQERTHEALADLFGCSVSDGTLAAWVEQASFTLAPTVAHIADLVAAGHHQHADETGVRIQGRLRWLHVTSTRWLTHLAWHPKRGRDVLDAIGIWPRFRGRATHDRWASFAAQPPPRAPDGQRRGGRHKPTPAKNLLDALLQHSARVLAFLDDLTVPFTNNQAKHDLRMAKVQQKLSGTFRSETGPPAYCRLRSYRSTMRKQGHGMLDALTAVFAGHPLSVAWGL